MKVLLFAVVATMLVSCASGPDWLGRLGVNTNSPGIGVAALSQEEIVSALKQALDKGVEHAVATLGQPNGFLADLSVKIPLPQSLETVANTLRTLGQGQLADEFVATMNRAAEKAVPQAAAVLVNSIQQMTLADARAILTGTNTAATAYFRRTSETNLYQRFYPIVGQATQAVGVTSAYKNMIAKLGIAGTLLGPGATDLDSYVTQKALDGLFLKIADEEKRIRENPLARTTELLQKVFGAISRP